MPQTDVKPATNAGSAGFLRRLFGPRRKRGRRRWWVPERLGVPGLFRELESRGCRYAILRWFEDLPSVEPGEDLDILVADEHVDLLCGLLKHGRRGAVSCDVYSATGLPGTAYRSMAYFPPHLAAQVLSRAVRHPSGAMVPCEEDHFLTLAYHALYHKGPPSGIPLGGEAEAGGADGGTPGAPEHDYSAALAALAVRHAPDAAITMLDLDRELGRRGWRPPQDTLSKLGSRNEWCRLLEQRDRCGLGAPRGLAVFIVREAAVREGRFKEVARVVAGEGFEPIACRSLSPEEATRAERSLRGGNWGRGPWPTSGGRPAAWIVGMDVFPAKPSPELLAKHPAADNARVFEAKERLRRWWNRGRPKGAQCNVAHSSDNAEHAAHYLEAVAPDEAERLLDEARKLAAIPGLSTAGRAIADLTRHGRRARVELVEWRNGGVAVRKTYRPGSRAHFEREVRAFEELRRIDPFDVIPPLLEKGGLHFVIPHYRDSLERDTFACQVGWRLFPLAELRKAFGAVRNFYEQGYLFLDFNPSNLILDPEEGLKLIDLEFVFHDPERTARAPFAESEVVRGPSESWDDVLPAWTKRDGKFYSKKWRPVAGLPVGAVLDGEVWGAELRRAVWRVLASAWRVLPVARKRLRKRLRSRGDK